MPSGVKTLTDLLRWEVARGDAEDNPLAPSLEKTEQKTDPKDPKVTLKTRNKNIYQKKGVGGLNSFYIDNSEVVNQQWQSSWSKLCGLRKNLPADLVKADGKLDFDTLAAMESVLAILDKVPADKVDIGVEELKTFVKTLDPAKVNVKVFSAFLKEVCEDLTVGEKLELTAPAATVKIRKTVAAEKRQSIPTLKTLQAVQDLLDLLTAKDDKSLPKSFSMRDLARRILPLLNKNVDEGLIDGDTDREAFFIALGSILSVQGQTAEDLDKEPLSFEIKTEPAAVLSFKAGTLKDIQIGLTVDAQGHFGLADEKPAAAGATTPLPSQIMLNTAADARSGLKQTSDFFKLLSTCTPDQMKQSLEEMLDPTKGDPGKALVQYGRPDADNDRKGVISGAYLFMLINEFHIEELENASKYFSSQGMEAQSKALDEQAKAGKQRVIDFLRQYVVAPALKKPAEVKAGEKAPEDVYKATREKLTKLGKGEDPAAIAEALYAEIVKHKSDGNWGKSEEVRGSGDKPGLLAKMNSEFDWLKLESPDFDTFSKSIGTDLMPVRLKDRVDLLLGENSPVYLRVLEPDEGKRTTLKATLDKLKDNLKKASDEKDDAKRKEAYTAAMTEARKDDPQLVDKLLRFDLSSIKNDPVMKANEVIEKAKKVIDSDVDLKKYGDDAKQKALKDTKTALEDALKKDKESDKLAAINDALSKHSEAIGDLESLTMSPKAEQKNDSASQGSNPGVAPSSPMAANGPTGPVSLASDHITNNGGMAETADYRVMPGSFDADGVPTASGRGIHNGMVVQPKNAQQAVFMKPVYKTEKGKESEIDHLEVCPLTVDKDNKIKLDLSKLEKRYGAQAFCLQNGDANGLGPVLWWDPAPNAGNLILISNDGSVQISKATPMGFTGFTERDGKWGQSFENDVLKKLLPQYSQISRDGKWDNTAQSLLPGSRPPGTGFFDAGVLPPEQAQNIDGSLRFLQDLLSTGGLEKRAIDKKLDEYTLKMVNSVVDRMDAFNSGFQGTYEDGKTKTDMQQMIGRARSLLGELDKARRDGKPIDPVKAKQADTLLAYLQAMIGAKMQELLRKAGKGKKDRDLDALIEQWLAGSISFECLLIMLLTVMLASGDDEIARCLKDLNKSTAAMKGLPAEYASGGMLQSMQTESQVDQLRLQNLIGARQRLIETVSNGMKSHQEALMNSVRRIV